MRYTLATTLQTTHYADEESAIAAATECARDTQQTQTVIGSRLSMYRLTGADYETLKALLLECFFARATAPDIAYTMNSMAAKSEHLWEPEVTITVDPDGSVSRFHEMPF